VARAPGAGYSLRMRRPALALAATLFAACASNHSVGPPPPDTTGAGAFLDTLQQRTFAYFWDRTNTSNGLTPDRWPTPSFSSIAAVGFALTAYPIGIERGYITRAQGASRVLTTLRFFWTAPHDSSATATGYHGFFYHFLDINTGARYQTVELSTIDSALLLAGVLTCQSYFTGADTTETQIRALAESLYARADWQWAASKHPPAITLAWTPENGFSQYDWKGYNEAMLIYILALGSPTHPADTAAWSAWTSTYQWGTFRGQTHLGFAPLFGHQYSQVWIDFRGIQDAYMKGRGIDYFENSRRATLAQQAYAAANPGGWKGYGGLQWGLTASDGPADVPPYHTYYARGASFTEIQDDGTIAPTAVGAAIAFAPEIAVPTLLSLRRIYGANLFGTYGFFDAFNTTFSGTPGMGHLVPGVGWFDTDYLGIDQGPIVAMVENYRTGLVWQLLRGNAHVVLGLCRAGFTGGWLAGKCP
jgi:hypothetical protein